MPTQLWIFDDSQWPTWILKVKRLVLSTKTGGWCKLPYPGHSKGCPNYYKSAKCPPKAPHLADFIDLSKPLYLVWSEFDLKRHVEKMKRKHPGWSDRQCRCVLYWQSQSRKQLKERTQIAAGILKTNRTTTCPEAMGVNVFATARVSGLLLERTRSIETCRHVSLIGTAG